MPNRNTEGNYRYAYQGQEKDPETGMEAFELRLWDTRIGRWLTIDPGKQYFSSYLGMGNNPINGIDPDGAKFILTGLTTTQRAVWNSQVNRIRSTKLGRQIFDKIENDENWVVNVVYGDNWSSTNFEYDVDEDGNRTLTFGSILSAKDVANYNAEKGNSNHSAWLFTGHEIFHAWDHYLFGVGDFISEAKKNRIYYEGRAIKFQNYLFTGGNLMATPSNTIGLRTHYGQQKAFDKFGSYLSDYHDFNSKLETLYIKSNLDNFPSRMLKLYLPINNNSGGEKILNPRHF